MKLNGPRHFRLYLLIAAAVLSVGCPNPYGHEPDPVLEFHADRTEIVSGEKVHIELKYWSGSPDDCALTDSPVDEYGEFVDDPRYLGNPVKIGQIDGKPVWRIGVQGAPDHTTEMRAVCGPRDHVSRHLIVITVLPAAPAMIAFLASPDTVNAGDPVNLIWAVNEADECTIEPGGETAETGAHSLVVYPGSSTTYVLVCSSSDRIASSYATVTVNP